MRSEYLSREKEIIIPNLKKGKLKTKKLLKINRYIRWTRVLSAINGASLKLRKYVFQFTIQNMESGRHSIYIWN